jgi:hypothetical protein
MPQPIFIVYLTEEEWGQVCEGLRKQKHAALLLKLKNPFMVNAEPREPILLSKNGYCPECIHLGIDGVCPSPVSHVDYMLGSN